MFGEWCHTIWIIQSGNVGGMLLSVGSYCVEVKIQCNSSPNNNCQPLIDIIPNVLKGTTGLVCRSWGAMSFSGEHLGSNHTDPTGRSEQNEVPFTLTPNN